MTLITNKGMNKETYPCAASGFLVLPPFATAVVPFAAVASLMLAIVVLPLASLAHVLVFLARALRLCRLARPLFDGWSLPPT